MTATYDSPDVSEKDEVRFLIGDTDMDHPLVQDEEIDYMVDKWLPIQGSVEYVAATVAESIAAKYAREANYSADGVNVSLAAVAQQFRELATSLRAQHKNSLVGGLPDVGGISPYEGPDPTVTDKDFGTGMHDNPEAGRQNYGNRDFYYGYYDPYNQPGE